MIELYRSDFMIVNFIPDVSLLETVWKQMSVRLSEELLKNEMKANLRYIDKYEPARVLTNAKNFFYKIPPHSQTWVNNAIFNKYHNAGVEKLAFIVSDDIVAQISIEQAIQESPNQQFEIRYFEKISNAQKWLLETVYEE